MHFEILVEDRSGSLLVDAVLPKILGPNGQPHTWRLHPYKGIGHLPRDLRPDGNPAHRQLLEQLPRLLRGYGRSLQNTESAVVVVVDADRTDCRGLKTELLALLADCQPRPTTLFRIAVEETEAWLLGDRSALERAYPKAKAAVLDGYVPDAVCGTWELLADAVFPGGTKRLKPQGYARIGQEKCAWAREIGGRLDVEENHSPSFRAFRDGLRRLARLSAGGDSARPRA